jgi:hypothetical protein
MQVGTLNVKLVARRLQNSNSDFQVMLLAGFTPALTHATAPYVETLSPNHRLTPTEIDGVVARLVRHSNSRDWRDISAPGMQRRLARIMEGRQVTLGPRDVVRHQQPQGEAAMW